MADPASDPEPPSGAALAVALARGEATGLLAALDAHGSDLVGYAEFVLADRSAIGDEAAAAVRDALLVATVAAVDLTDPSRMRAWLLALTRNECLRRHPGPGLPAATEAAELGRRGLLPAEIAQLIDVRPDHLPADPPAPTRRPDPTAGPAREPDWFGAGPAAGSGRTPSDRPGRSGAVPGWLRDEVVAAAGDEGTARRVELARRARPFDPDGFPVPLDRRRLSGRALAWSAAAAVVLALGVLVALPARDGAGAATQGPLLAAASVAAAPAATPAEDPLPTLADAPFGSAPGTSPAGSPAGLPAGSPAGSPGGTPSRRPEPAADRGTGRDPVTPGTTAERPDSARAAVTLTWSQVRCGDRWTAALRATTGAAAVTEVVVTGGARTVALRRDGDGWSGQLDGLPTDRSVVVTVSAGDGVRPAVRRLSATC